MDGVLIDSEGFWRLSMIEQFEKEGIHLTSEECAQTKGRKINEVVSYWNALFDNRIKDESTIVNGIINGVCELIKSKGETMFGIYESLQFLKQSGVRMAIASSSSMRIIETVVDALQLGEFFDLVHSAEFEMYGKPHPAVFLTASQKLFLNTSECLVVEDSIYGLIAAKSAQIKCIVIPEKAELDDPRWVLADAKYQHAKEINWGRILLADF